MGETKTMKTRKWIIKKEFEGYTIQYSIMNKFEYVGKSEALEAEIKVWKTLK